MVEITEYSTYFGSILGVLSKVCFSIWTIIFYACFTSVDFRFYVESEVIWFYHSSFATNHPAAKPIAIMKNV